ncbi:hypothetical protein SUGI_0270490 [Cryptomeria japonica]|nr:hypothetical protein SUGI_0270490 [Cryptomeria japonica]
MLLGILTCSWADPLANRPLFFGGFCLHLLSRLCIYFSGDIFLHLIQICFAIVDASLRRPAHWPAFGDLVFGVGV